MDDGDDDGLSTTNDTPSTKNDQQLWSLKKHEIEAEIAKLSWVMRKKYPKKKETKYGSINKGFTDEELATFLGACRNEKARLAFTIMAMLGLRVGEVVKIRTEDLDFERNRIKISTEKARTGDFLLLHPQVLIALTDWVQKHGSEIRTCDNYVLFAQASCSPMKHVSSNWLRNAFRKTIIEANMNESYAMSDETRFGLRHPRKLHRLTTHSLRHYFITKIYRQCRDIVQAQKLARHRESRSTLVYIHVPQEKLDSTLKSTFEHQENNDMQEYLEYMRFKKLKNRV